jgi:putative endonuclease
MSPQSLRIAMLERGLSALDAIARKRGRSDEAAHLSVGLRGEDAAFFYLLCKGYTVVARRWSSGHVAGDVDLIAWQGDLLCFFEVKTRSERDATPAEAAVDRHKRFTLRRLARAYLRQLGRETSAENPVRFDVVSVYLAPGRAAEMDHFEGAFGWREGADRRA